jgi:hypothetical protein
MFKRLRKLLYGRAEETPRRASPDFSTDTSPRKEEANVSSPEQARAYLEKVQGKINRLAEEFASGSINRAQFQELFEHYRREQQTINRWIELSPGSDAWRGATTEGKSIIIRRENIAKVFGYTIYETASGMPLKTIGQFEIDAELAVPMLSSYRAATKEIFGAGMSSTEIEGGRWLCYVPGEFTTLMSVFSTEPASKQLAALEELHRLFERANRNLLSAEFINPDELVFPHAHFLGRMQ